MNGKLLILFSMLVPIGLLQQYKIFPLYLVYYVFIKKTVKNHEPYSQKAVRTFVFQAPHGSDPRHQLRGPIDKLK